MLVAWHPIRWWKFCMREDEKKKIEPILLYNALNATVIYNMKHFGIETKYILKNI